MLSELTELFISYLTSCHSTFQFHHEIYANMVNICNTATGFSLNDLRPGACDEVLKFVFQLQLPM